MQIHSFICFRETFKDYPIISTAQQIENKIGQQNFSEFLANYHLNDQSANMISEDVYRKIIQNIQEWKIRNLKVPFLKGRNPRILFEISHIDFSKLIEINLIDAQINNIEPLGWMNFPSLKSLELQDNHITSLKPFSKLISQSILKIRIFVNYFSHDQIDELCRMKASQLQILNISWQVSKSKSPFTIDIANSLAKLQSAKISSYMVISLMVKNPIIDKFSEKFQSKNTIKNNSSFVDSFIFGKLIKGIL